jgi:thioredoxin reductase
MFLYSSLALILPPTEIIDDDVIKVTKRSDDSFQLSTRSGSEFLAKSLILATGAQSLWLDARNEETFKG